MQNNSDDSQQTSAASKAYEVLRDMILNGDLPSGARITEGKIATMVGVSRTPIREAIQRLEHEHLIVNKIVVKPTETELRHTFQVRILLEGYSARCAAMFFTEKDFESLAEFVKIGRTGSLDEIMRANEQFHETIVRASNNPIMIDIIESMKSIIYLFSRTVVTRERPFLIDEHETIYETIKAHDADKAEQLMNQHLQADLDFSLHFINN
ncbi:GntR family transcriptional regulator [Sporolactobacillus kofuensis]|uniref:GntR family transcriptional regulator n=1 Tax=Sporolactobacillus kofuensis TaxID=269672 RepID=A0ABW1WFK3_9BACL|nr:GntR family transcriptional regulator [Sporolactobacillus kofuensis]MCO7174886.1 GntR family transcriptional regulator [Sporolactobacillus kofuensis]